MPAQMETSLPARPESLWRARELLRELLLERGFATEGLRDGLFVASELVSNAVRHASGSGDEIGVAYALRGAELHIRITDADRGHDVPVALPPDETRTSGRGLQIVGCLADWSDRVVDGKREVTAVLLLPTESRLPHD